MSFADELNRNYGSTSKDMYFDRNTKREAENCIRSIKQKLSFVSRHSHSFEGYFGYYIEDSTYGTYSIYESQEDFWAIEKYAAEKHTRRPEPRYVDMVARMVNQECAAMGLKFFQFDLVQLRKAVFKTCYTWYVKASW